MPLTLEPLGEQHFERLHRLFDAVCRERRFMAFTDGGPQERAFAYYAGIVEAGHTHFVALDGEEVIGWCDVLPLMGQMRAHAGILGMAVSAGHRGHGVGKALIQAAIAGATERGFTRIELTVHSENQVAQGLYKRVGFQHEGVHRNAWRIEGRYYDVYFMARLSDA
ncbi:MAG: GNAT family N-acetyltransferase [Burkholderiaceae bacterium]|nr:GNAT family N-acetyltransferase [Burkholderiaceae bacterium]